MNIEHEDNDRNDCVAAMTREPNNNSNIRSNDHNNNTAALSRLRYGSHYLSSCFACRCPSLSNIISSSRSNSSKTTPTRDVATTSQQRSSSNSSNASSSLVFSRLLFMLCLSLVAIVLGYLVHRFLTEAEIDLAQEQFASIADRAVNEAAEIGRRNKWTMGTMAELAGQMQPNPDEWPFVYISGYEEIGTKLIQTVSEGEVLALAPFVEPEQLQEWENFAYDYFDNVAKFPNGTGINPEWGKGVWKTDRTRETDGFANGSKYQVIFPTFQSQIGPDPVLMFNLRSGEDRRAAIDPIIDCSLKRMNSSDPVPGYKCASMTDMVAIVRYETRGPAAVLYEPIYPANGGGLQVRFVVRLFVRLLVQSYNAL
mgnify:CR=1 FL=1